MTEQERLDGHRAQAEEWLRSCFQGRAPRGDLYDAMYYSLLAGGKRIRPVLLLSATEYRIRLQPLLRIRE